MGGAELLIKVDSKTQQYLDVYEPEKRSWQAHQQAVASAAGVTAEPFQTEEELDANTRTALAELLAERAPAAAAPPMDESSKNASLAQQVRCRKVPRL